MEGQPWARPSSGRRIVEGEVVVEPVRRVSHRPLVEVEDREQSSGHGAGGETELRHR